MSPNTGNNTVEPDGGEWRIQGANKTFIKVDTNNGTCGVFNLQTPSADHHAISRGYVKDKPSEIRQQHGFQRLENPK